MEELPREGLVDDGHRRRATAIGGIERATAPQRNTERPEVVSGDHSIVRFGRVLGDDAVQKERRGGEIAVHRDDVGRRDGADAGEGRDSRLDLVGELFDRGAPTVPRAGQRQPNRQDLRRVEPGIDRLDVLKAARQQHGRHQQDGRQRDLGEHECGADAIAATARPAVAVLQRAAEIAPRRLQRRCEADDQAGAERQTSVKRGDGRIDADLGHARESRGSVRDQRLDQHPGDNQAERAAHDAEDGGFAEDERDHPASGRAERGADRELLPVRRAANEEETGEVRTGDEEDEHDGSEEHQQHRPGLTGQLLVQ